MNINPKLLSFSANGSDCNYSSFNDNRIFEQPTHERVTVSRKCCISELNYFYGTVIDDFIDCGVVSKGLDIRGLWHVSWGVFIKDAGYKRQIRKIK